MGYSFSAYGKNISKILRAIDLLARSQGASNKELASHLGLSMRSVFRLLSTLQDLGSL
jgi:DNA-binding IclR family transcriptional regulator